MPLLPGFWLGRWVGEANGEESFVVSCLCLAVVLVGENPASKVYVAGKEKDCAECGILSRVLRMPETTTQEELLETVKALNKDYAG